MRNFITKNFSEKLKCFVVFAFSNFTINGFWQRINKNRRNGI